MLSSLYISRLLVYHAAHLLDEHKDAMVEVATAKMFTSDTFEKLASDAVQVMGGDGWTRFYPVEGYLRDAKVSQIGGGTNQIMKLVVFRGGLKSMDKELKMLRRHMNDKLKVPTSTTEPPPKVETTEGNILKVLAEDYLVNPGLYMTREDLKQRLNDATDEKLDATLKNLESEGLAKLHCDAGETIALVKATYNGLRRAAPLEKYKWYPDWLKKEYIF